MTVAQAFVIVDFQVCTADIRASVSIVMHVFQTFMAHTFEWGEYLCDRAGIKSSLLLNTSCNCMRTVLTLAGRLLRSLHDAAV